MAGTIQAYETAAGKRYRVRYRKPDKSQTDKRGFKTKREAQLFLASVTVSKATGDYIDPALGRVRVADLAERWLAGKKVLKPSAYDPLPRAWRNHVEPTFGDREIRSIVPSEVQEWVAELRSTRSASVTLRALGVLAGILDMAIDDGRIKKNPARGLRNRPKKPKRKTGRVYLSHEQVKLLADESAHPMVVLLLVYTGVRWGELAALRVRAVNVLRRRLHVEENASTVNGVVQVAPPKSWEVRSVPYPKFLAAKVRALLGGSGPDELVFPNTTGGHRTIPKSDTGWFATAVKRCQAIDPTFPRVTLHDMRHTAASLAVSAGANVKALQHMLGHEAAAHTLDIYSDLFPDDVDSVAAALDKQASALWSAA